MSRRRRWQEEALALWRVVGSPNGYDLGAACNLGWSLLALGKEAQARPLPRGEPGPRARDRTLLGRPLCRSLYLGWAAYLRGEHERAAALQEQALALYRQVNYRWGVSGCWLPWAACCRRRASTGGRRPTCGRPSCSGGRSAPRVCWPRRWRA